MELGRELHSNLSQVLTLLSASTDPADSERDSDMGRENISPYIVTLIQSMIYNYIYSFKIYNCLFQGELEAA